MRVAIAGWGDLIWDPGSLALESEWLSDGPEIPLEFCRISGGRRVTLAILPEAAPEKTYWAMSSKGDLVRAAKNLRQRCKTFPDLVHYCDKDGQTHPDARPELTGVMQRWLKEHLGIDAVAWSGLESNWELKQNRRLEVNHLTEFLRELEKVGTAGAAREYFERTPPLNRTALWDSVIKALQWEPVPTNWEGFRVRHRF